MKTKPFFPRFDAKFTMTPNVFFELVVTEASTLNEVRAVSYIIRKTIGWNKKFECITRSQFVAEAGISNGQLTRTLQSCLDKGWLLCFRAGEKGKEENFYFLNDTLNAKLVFGLKQGLFGIQDLEYKSEEGLIQLLIKHGIDYESDADETEKNDDTKTGGVRKPYGYGNRTGTGPVVAGVRGPEGYPYGGRRGRGTAPVEVDTDQTQAQQGFADPLNTTTKYNVLNTKDQIQQQNIDLNNGGLVLYKGQNKINSENKSKDSVVVFGKTDKILQQFWKIAEKRGTDADFIEKLLQRYTKQQILDEIKKIDQTYVDKSLIREPKALLIAALRTQFDEPANSGASVSWQVAKLRKELDSLSKKRFGLSFDAKIQVLKEIGHTFSSEAIEQVRKEEEKRKDKYKDIYQS